MQVPGLGRKAASPQPHQALHFSSLPFAPQPSPEGPRSPQAALPQRLQPSGSQELLSITTGFESRLKPSVNTPREGPARCQPSRGLLSFRDILQREPAAALRGNRRCPPRPQPPTAALRDPRRAPSPPAPLFHRGLGHNKGTTPPHTQNQADQTKRAVN